ncbi:hypothetical protein Emag_005157 [Eimeria magna]
MRRLSPPCAGCCKLYAHDKKAQAPAAGGGEEELQQQQQQRSSSSSSSGSNRRRTARRGSKHLMESLNEIRNLRTSTPNAPAAGATAAATAASNAAAAATTAPAGAASGTKDLQQRKADSSVVWVAPATELATTAAGTYNPAEAAGSSDSKSSSSSISSQDRRRPPPTANAAAAEERYTRAQYALFSDEQQQQQQQHACTVNEGQPLTDSQTSKRTFAGIKMRHVEGGHGQAAVTSRGIEAHKQLHHLQFQQLQKEVEHKKPAVAAAATAAAKNAASCAATARADNNSRGSSDSTSLMPPHLAAPSTAIAFVFEQAVALSSAASSRISSSKCLLTSFLALRGKKPDRRCCSSKYSMGAPRKQLHPHQQVPQQQKQRQVSKPQDPTHGRLEPCNRRGGAAAAEARASAAAETRPAGEKTGNQQTYGSGWDALFLDKAGTSGAAGAYVSAPAAATQRSMQLEHTMQHAAAAAMASEYWSVPLSPESAL